MRDGLLQGGPELADDSNVLAYGQWRRALGVNLDDRWARSRARLLIAVLAAWGALCVALWWIGYPSWRVVVVCASLCAVIGAVVSGARAAAERVGALMPFLATAVTGGVHSPMLVGVSAQFIGEILRKGWSPQTRNTLIGYAALVVTMALAPASLVGPQIAEPTFSITLVGTLLLGVGIHCDYLVMVMASGSEVVRQLIAARDARANDALARAADMERMSSHLSHELKNPLGAIKALVQLSLRGAHGPELRERLEVVSGEVERMQSILQGYLSFSRPLAADGAPMDHAR